MSFYQIFKNLIPYVKPYKLIILATLFLTLVGSVLAQVNALVLQYAVDSVSALVGAQDKLKDGFVILTWITAILLGKEILVALITFCQRFLGAKLRISISKRLALKAVDRILTYRMSFFSAKDNDAGKLQTRIDRGVESLTRLVNNFFLDILPLIANAVLALILMFRSNVKVGLVALCIIPVFFYITILQGKKLRGWRENHRHYREAKSHSILNILQSISVIKSFNREKIESDKQYDLQQQITDNQLKTNKTGFLFDGLKSFVEQIGVVLIIIISAYLVIQGEMTIGAIMMQVMLYNNVSSPIRQLHRIYDDMNDALVYSEGYFDVISADQEIEDRGSVKTPDLDPTFVVRDVDFTYPNGPKALKKVSLTIEKGKITALVGLSGAGKTTLINLLDKFYEPDSGSITLGGIELSQFDTEYLRDNIGIVMQKNHIFEGSIEENILYGRPDATHDEVVQAAKDAYIYDQIMDLPKQFESPATQLSGGQQQRIAIARIFLKNPPILFLDEPTASLDAIATEQIKNSIDAIKKNRTVVIISHSISQIIDADIIYAMKQGQIVEHGKHEDLYRQKGVYHDIFDASARSLNIVKLAQTFDIDGDGRIDFTPGDEPIDEARDDYYILGD
ncbi:MAG: ABC transporter ATP-binding protein [Proteobacteria bacterium]|nr:ABC transporter ATP-binding protein [Pseudomonadota bacterium]